MTQPNILFIMCDQLAAQALSFYGHPLVKTPNLDALAAESVIFENAYCNSPLCGPSRAAFMTGQLPSRIGAYDNAAAFASDVPTIAHYLRQRGYQTTLCGKMHFAGPDQLHGFEERLTTDIYPADYGWVPDWENFAERPTWYHNMLSVVQAGTCVTSNQIGFDDAVAFLGERKLIDLARSEDQRPFFLLTSFTHPHDPFAITQEYWDRYEHDAIEMPTVPQMAPEELDLHSQRLHHVCALGNYEQTDARVRNARHAYYGMISYIDDKVGQLLGALERSGQKENTIVVFTSDHGEMLGERGLWYKMSFFEPSARVPLLIFAPERYPHRRVSASVSLVDLLPTLVDLAGGNSENDLVAPIDGESLCSLMDENGTDEVVERVVLSEILSEGAVAPCVMIRRGRYKYIYASTDPEQFYDLEADPHEQHNLAALQDAAFACLWFSTEVAKRWDLDALHQSVLESQRNRRLVHTAMTEGKRTVWDFQPMTDAGEQYMRGHMDLNVLERTARYPTPETTPPLL